MTVECNKRADVGELFSRVMAGPNRQPCAGCGKSVKAEYCFCWVCGRVVCDACGSAHPKTDKQ